MRRVQLLLSMHALESVAHPVRLAIVRRLSDQGPASLGELAQVAGVHENTARTHIAALEAAGVIASERRPSDRPGRPRVSYRLADALVLAPSTLTQLLGAALARTGPADGELRATGRDWGRYLAGRPGRHDLAQKIPEVLAELGWDAHLDGQAVELRNCPCKSVASDQPRLLCLLGEGVVDGTVAACGAAMRIERAVHDPDRRICRIELVDTKAAKRPRRQAPRPRRAAS
jgi:predicted ArsR family transcriptional regulator